MRRFVFIVFMVGLFAAAGQAQHTHGKSTGKGVKTPRDAPREAGQATFAALKEAVDRLLADPKTDWTKVEVDRLREHLVDMDLVFTASEVTTKKTERGFYAVATGDARTRAALERMVPAHARTIDGHRGWKIKAEAAGSGVGLSVESEVESERAVIRALGFYGVMTQGGHHGPHHLQMLKGEFDHGHGGPGHGHGH